MEKAIAPQSSKLFWQTRAKLAIWYASVMGVILALCGVGVYEGIAHAHKMTLHREVASVAGTLHDSLEPVLDEPGRLTDDVRRFLPDLCRFGDSCITNTYRHAVGALRQGEYYAYLLDNGKTPIAVAGTPPSDLPLPANVPIFLTDVTETRYYQVTIKLHTQDNRDWGYLQMGRSLEAWDNYLNAVLWLLLLGFPLALLVVGSASWVLAGLAMQPIYDSYQQIQRFTGDAAHELRTPLAAIRAMVESTLRLKRIDEAEARETLTAVRRQNQRLSELATDLLLLSRMERGIEMPRRACCLNDIVADVEEELAALAVQERVSLRVEIPKMPIEVWGDEGQLYRAIANLVANGIQYTLEGGTVTVRLAEVTPFAVVEVEDTGIGIAEADRDRLFDRFYRVQSDRSRHTGGSGLGLSIVRAIVRSHQGKITLESELGRGSCFTVRLPLKV
ncbi:two-component system sensor histidine kinase RppB [Baaleninema simplex]|uniref:two-component system sensor histidine kinase RppB n=1 Tax=Baaleninema simplex TaxID=2862350 RepID=UPI00034BD59B|nr:two-component system sensor histidine kinase RppB [Baaleninema simplex]